MPAIDEHDTEVVDRDWDGPSLEASLPNDWTQEEYEEFYAWRDPDADADTKGAYSFPHHHLTDENERGAANENALVTGIAILNGAQLEGTPQSQPWGDDREAIWKHLANHLEDADLEPPELNSKEMNGWLKNQIEERDLDVSIEQKTEDQDEEKQGTIVKEKTDNGVERRNDDAYSMEVRATHPDSDDEEERIEGHAAVFNEPANIGPFVEEIDRGAFQKTLNDGADVRALFNHDPNHVLGRRSSGTLELEADERGLHYSIDPPSWADDLVESIERGDITQSSFGFKAVKEDWGKTDDGEDKRIIREAKLLDVSPVTFPAYDQTDADVRSRYQAVANKHDLNPDELIEALSRSEGGKLTTRYDKKVVKEWLKRLNEIEGETEPSSNGHSVTPNCIKRKRKELELLKSI